MDQTVGSFHGPMTAERHLEPLDDAEKACERQDDWGESRLRSRSWGASPQHSMSSSMTSPSKYRSRLSPLHNSRSAPLLPAAHSSHTSTWYSASDASDRSLLSPTSPMWSPLGSTWRKRMKDEFGHPVRKNVDEGHGYAEGCVPHWNKMNLRKTKALEHELTWCYYRMRRHESHPERQNVGDPALPPDRVVAQMRDGKQKQFQFWRDLRPPFRIAEIRRDQDEPHSGHHPDGDLFHVTYQCGIDYVGERLWNKKANSSTFDNMIYGVADIRIPDAYPRQKTITIVSWGQPTLNYSPDECLMGEDGIPLEGGFVDPNKWMPISDELNLSPGLDRFAACREATRKANSRRAVMVKPLQALLLGPHATLPRIAAAVDQNSGNFSSPDKEGTSLEGGTPSPSRKKRQHRIFTAAAGFVRYAG